MSQVKPPSLDVVLAGDCSERMATLPPASVDMVFADPPYNLQLKGDLLRPNNQGQVDGVTAAWDRFDDFAAYDAFTESWLIAVKRILKPDGTLWVIGSYHNIFRIGATLQNLGFWMLNDVIWLKTNPMPNFRGRRFTNAHETLIWCSTGKDARYQFNYKAMKALNEDTQMRSDWSLPICAGAERLRENGQKSHPTQKPEALLYRVILASTETGDVILDPFFGTGTTGVVAKKLKRHYIGIEREAAYRKLARTRLAAVHPLADDEVLELAKKKMEKRIPFGWLIERGLLAPGTVLTDHKKRYAAKVRADGHLIAGDIAGSIHKVGAFLQNLPACNGWTFWCLDVSGKSVPIDVLRQRLRAELH